jgi:hypothetical protein
MTDLRALLDSTLSADAKAWLDQAVERVTTEPTAIRTLFPAARRRCGHARLDDYWTVDEAVRAVLIGALPPTARTAETAGLYRHGERVERRAVLRALSFVDSGEIDEIGLALVREALFSNDSTLIEAALGPYGASHLPSEEYRQAVLKCVFTEIPLDRIEGLPDRADGELARMLADFACERVAAGREVPADIWPVVRAFPDATEAQRAAILADTTSTVPSRREAATRALANFTKRADSAHI